VVTHFERYGEIDGIADPTIIADCAAHKTVLLTADGDMETTWAAEIEKAKIHVVILTNNCDGADKWGQRLTKGRQAIVDKLRRYRKPAAITFGRDAKVCKVRLYGKRRAKVIVI
jgi:predicted nuclease of predicted toxin-antitoxin system